ncbi:hypothetical protein [Myxococcus sp. Y35]|uniref:hypothetical protein n=1 Tax=Pseudomyxococcus flavus TaxID=3115648 RepID=UPI003CF5D21B
MSSKTSVLEPLRVRVRRFQFIMGLGFIAVVAGSILSVALTLRLSVRIQAVPVGVLRVALAVLLENLWVLGVLPLLSYFAARIIELRPWTTAGGAAVAGSAFVHALAFVQNGVNGLWLGGLGSLLSVAAFAGGVVLTARAVTMGRAAAAQQTVKAQTKAQERKSEYDEFLRAAEQGGARLEQREAQAATSGGTASDAASVASATPDVAAAQLVATPESNTSEQAGTSDGAQTQPGTASTPTAVAQAAAEPPVSTGSVPSEAEHAHALQAAASVMSAEQVTASPPSEPPPAASTEERKSPEA